jgi:hypothetical protein
MKSFERSTVAIDSSNLFLIVRLRSVEMHNIKINTVHGTASNYYNKFIVL